jgi:hypothetical protein
LTHQQLGQVQEAIADFERVIEISGDPNLLAGAESRLRELESGDNVLEKKK